MRLFLAATRELEAERSLVARTVDRLNREHEATNDDPWAIELVDWGAQAAPLLAPPRGSSTPRPTIGDSDAFLGLAWLRFDPPATETAAGCEDAFALARELWQDAEKPAGLFLRCTRLPESLERIDGESFARVQRFFAALAPANGTAIGQQAFHGAQELDGHLRRLLLPIIARQRAEPTAIPPRLVPTSPPPAAATADELGHRFEPGRAYEVSLLAIALSGYDDLVRNHPEEALARLVRSFRALVESTAATYGGELLSWHEGSGVLIFTRSRSGDHAAMTGLKILHTLPIFNLDPDQNPLAEGVVIEAAAHDAIIVYEPPLEDLASPDLGFAVELRESFTDPGELCVSKRLFDQLDERLQPHFSFKGRLGPEPVHACRLTSRGGAAVPQESLAVRTKQVEETLAALRERLKKGYGDDGEEPISTALDRVYAALGRYCADFSILENEWSAAFLTALANAATSLVRAELALWQVLRAHIRDENPPDAGLVAIVHGISRRRSRPVIILGKLVQRCRMLARSEPKSLPPTEEDELRPKLDALLRADALDLETALTDLLLNHKRSLLRFLVLHTTDARHQPVLDRLWEAADLVLLDDLFAIRDHRRADDPKVVETLLDRRIRDGRFTVVNSLLSRIDRPDDRQITAAFARVGVRADESDLQVVWRCLVLAHSDAGTRAHAAFYLSLYSAWQTISHPSIPLASISALGERFSKREDENAQKIFFDCIRERLKSAAESFRDGDELETLTKVVLQLLDFGFLVESGYFERFDDLLGTFLSRAQSMGMSVAYFEGLREKLESAWRTAGKEGKLPAGIQKLPLTIQRRLAGDPRYIFWFVTHPDPRIAGETIRHIGLANVERMLRLREISAPVMAAVLKRPELFTRKQPLIQALNHPKCTHTFASRYLPGMARTRGGQRELQRLARNPSANPAVRAAAQQLLKRARGRARV